ncbi:hypothetical protein [Cohnella sp. GCM10027633]|uniref:hypothetical protein n=1 Tax=unclassified Cohnella TaxID=2636738 RepID=UPI003640C11A
MKRRYRSFNRIFIVGCASVLLVIILLNLLVDPYGVWRSPVDRNLNLKKPNLFTHQRMLKAADIIHDKPKVVFLGSSKVQNGLEPDDYFRLTGKPAYNLGMGGAVMSEQLAYLKHALYNQPSLNTVVIGLDFRSFNRFRPVTPDYDEARLQIPSLLLSPDFFKTTITLDAIKESINTIKANKDSNYPENVFNRNGKRTEQSLQAENGGRNMIDIFAGYWSASMNSTETYKTYELSEQYLDDFKAIVELCKDKRIKLLVFVSPSHASLVESIRVAGQWDNYEQWKRKLVEITPLWDFSGYNSITSEPITNQMQNYWDSTHYRKNVGKMVLERMLAINDERLHNDFGVWIENESTMETHLQTIRQLQLSWNEQNVGIVKMIQDLKPTA